MFEGRWAWAEVDLDALAHNVRVFKTLVGDKTLLAIVLKANACSHGAVPAARTVLAAGADWLAVNTCDEGVQLRRAGIGARTLLLGYTPASQAATVVANRLTPTVNTIEMAEALSALAGATNPLPIHVKVDTGLSRYGLLPDEIVPFCQRLSALPGIRLEGLFSHFASADAADKTAARRQVAIYTDTVNRLKEAGITIPLRHLAASGAILDMPETYLDMVRCGISAYGLYPSDEVSRAIPLRPTMSLKARIARLRTLPPGTGVGYGSTFITARPTLAALIPIGYADGVKRGYSNKGTLLVHGRRVPVIGRVSMDQLTIDVTDVPGVAEGDEVVLVGEQGDERITWEEYATVLGTIIHEVIVGIAPRVPRVYIQDGREVGYTTLVEERWQTGLNAA